jgi:hypothetical protein
MCLGLYRNGVITQGTSQLYNIIIIMIVQLSYWLKYAVAPAILWSYTTAFVREFVHNPHTHTHTHTGIHKALAARTHCIHIVQIVSCLHTRMVYILYMQSINVFDTLAS